ncbi:hypothetical protein NQ318_014894 [Aromia moschata]|uniref:Acyltransferase 3 domain-containing protein n=1 Tax=Aromia moschata TaxID=1265417 RepID=A0AAV8YSL9_9CUCU|nr:hypothetical protein NQ318_014894 [Aromia moschata]
MADPNMHIIPCVYSRPTGCEKKQMLDFFLMQVRYNDTSKQARNVVKLGWCIPASCTPFAAEKYLNEYFSRLNYSLRKENITYSAEIPQILCTSSNGQSGLDGWDITILTLILILIVFTSTCWEYNNNYDKTEQRTLPYRIFLSFSARRNFHDLNKSESQDQALSNLYGIRTYAIFMIIMDHRFGIFTGSSSNFDYIEQLYRNIFVSYIFHGDLFVDTFFVISGLLVVYNLMTMLERKSLNPGYIVFMRYMRLTPAYAFIIFFTGTIFYHTGNGALWNAVVGTEVRDCRSNWWTNVLYISNYVNEDHMCMPHSWYLPCDFHYFMIAVGLTYIIKKEKTFGLIALSAMTILSLAIPFTIILVYERPAFLKFFTGLPGLSKDPSGLSVPSHARATPYFIGMFAGYVYYRLKGSGRILSKGHTAALLSISFFLLTVCMYTGYVFYDPYHTYNALESAIYGSLQRPVWALGTFGLVYAVSYGTCGFLHKFLSWHFWVPLSKLVYGAYLWHLQFQNRTLGRITGSQVFTFFDVITYGFGDICLAFLLALALHLGVEAPVKGILKEIFTPPKLDKTKTSEDADHQAIPETSKL